MNTAPVPNYGPLPTNESLGIIQGPDVDHSIDREDKCRDIIGDHRPLLCNDIRDPELLSSWETAPDSDYGGWSRR